MFYIHQSNHMEMLAKRLSLALGQGFDNNPFSQETVLVQSPGMSQWLKIYIAQTLGVMGNIEFPLPSSFIWSLYQQLISDLPQQSAFNKADMSFKIFTILPDHWADPDFLPLKNYLRDDDDGLMRFQLSEKIADVYDQYLMYRPDWIAAWESGENDIKGGDYRLQPWQPTLWRALQVYSQQLGQSSHHRANLHDQLLTKLPELVNQGTWPAHFPRRLFIFGISTLPRQSLDVFVQLSEYIDVHLMLFNPCGHYWGDIVDEKQLAKVEARFKGKQHLPIGQDNYLLVGNPLLASWGKIGRDYLEQLLDVPAELSDDFVEPEPQDMLSRIQADVFNLTFRDSLDPLSPAAMLTNTGKFAVSPTDKSLAFHSCHSPLREVEVLYDQLLLMFEQDPQLSPKDIIVMMPDVALYSPYIDSVFAAKQPQIDLSAGAKDSSVSLRIPYGISDKGFVLENPIINSFIQLLKLPQSRFSASELLDLIAVPATIRALDLAEDDIELIRHWIIDVGIRWGIDSRHKHSFDLPDDELNSWRFGLNRLLMGYAMGEMHFDGHSNGAGHSTADDGDQAGLGNGLVNGIVPYSHIEGQNAEVLGKLVQFFDLLIYYREVLAADQPIDDKIEWVKQLLSAFYAPDQDENTALLMIREVLTDLAYHQQQKNCLGPISQRLFAYYVSHGFNEKGVSQRFLAGQVNFCTLMPMRSIPFKVICLLGMNDADYPRFVAPIGFDLMAAGTPRKGDRSRRLDDRYLLLEALLSARDRLYLSFVGRSMQDNSPKIPSVLVTELQEYCQQTFILADGQTLQTDHPLQPFNRRYFTPDSGLTSYQQHWFHYVDHRIKRVNSPEPVEVNSPESVPAKGIDKLPLTQLLRFIQHPVKYFFNHTLQLYFTPLTDTELDDEHFALDALGRHQLVATLVQNKLKWPGLDQYPQISGGGSLPHRQVGRLAYLRLDNEAEQFVTAVQQYNLEFLPAVEVNMQVAGVNLTGWIKQLTSEGLLFYRPAKINGKDRLNAWLYHLVMSAMGRAVNTIHIGVDGGFILRPLAQQQAQLVLQQWVEFYQQGILQPQPFFVRSSEQWAIKGDIKAVQKAFSGDSFSPVPGEGDDLYIQRVFTSIDPLPSGFADLAQRIYEPLLSSIEVLS